MKVLMMVSYPEIGGTETHVLSLADEFRQYGIEVGVLTRGGPFVSTFRQHGMAVYKLSREARESTSSAAAEIVDIVDRHEYQIVHAHDSESFHLLRYIRQDKPKLPLIMTVHGTYYSPSELKRASSAATRMIAVSPRVRQWLMRFGISSSKITWIPNGIDTNLYSPSSSSRRYREYFRLPQQKEVVLYAGRFQSDKWKIARTLILASQRVAAKGSPFVVVIAGPGKYRAKIAGLAKAVNKSLGRKLVYVLPSQSDMTALYRAASFVVGTGRVALEAMACGKPILAAGRAGYAGLAAPKNMRRCMYNHFGDHGARSEITVDRLERDMRRLLVNPKYGMKLGKYGRRVVSKRYSIEQVAKRTRAVYTEVIAKS